VLEEGWLPFVIMLEFTKGRGRHAAGYRIKLQTATDTPCIRYNWQVNNIIYDLVVESKIMQRWWKFWLKE